MFNNTVLKDYLKTASSVSSRPEVLIEWNMNVASNIDTIGNYRYRPTISSPTEANYGVIAPTFVKETSATSNPKYYGATNADTKVDGGYDTSDNPIVFTTVDKKEGLLYSLEDCFYRFRPRSGINKLRYFDDRYTHFANASMAKRPRYYIADKKDKFKYWTSYRKENGLERGISYTSNAEFYIDDAAPFVVYKNVVPTNRIVVKMQTNVGDVNLGPFANSFESFSDPFYGSQNKTVPIEWEIQYLKGTTWTSAVEFSDPESLVNNDGYVEIAYGVLKPTGVSTFKFMGALPGGHTLPTTDIPVGTAYLVKYSTITAGKVAVWDGTTYTEYDATYGWYLRSESSTDYNGIATELVNTPAFTVDSVKTYREFQEISGIRVIAKTMNVFNSTFDIIEISPRLVADISDKTSSVGATKSLSDLGLDGLPVGQLIAGTGELVIFDYDNAFNENNENSIIKNHILSKFQVKLSEIISVPSSGDVKVPIKILYSDIPPEQNVEGREVSLSLKDLMFYFDSITAPQLLLENVSLTTAVSILLDNIGFSNYKFNKLEGEKDVIIPHFFVGPETTVSEVLQELAVSTQSAMYFDEENNFVVVSKNYMLPTNSNTNTGGRATDIVLSGTKDYSQDGVVKNKPNETLLSNIASISSYANKVYNAGTIRYNRRYIQRSYGSLKQSTSLDNDKTWIYKPVLLWEVSGTEATKNKNDENVTQSNYVLTAIPLATDISETVPQTVISGEAYTTTNNVIDLGQGIQWIARYNGYLYANGEIIKYDAVEYNVQGVGTVWINNANEYQDYFAKIPFNGRIYPTGRIRIYSEPKYSVTNGVATPVAGAALKHGRGQFGTTIANHKAGLDPYWSNNDNISGIKMKSKYLFGKNRSYKASEVYSSNLTHIKVPNASNIYIGDTVTIVTGTGKITYGTRVTDIVLSEVEEEYDTITINKALESPILQNPVDSVTGEKIVNTIMFQDFAYSQKGIAAKSTVNTNKASQSARTGIIKNFFSNQYVDETEPTNLVPGTLQSSALVFKGPNFSGNDGVDFISYVYKNLGSATNKKFTHYGTRLRIIGELLVADKSSSQSKQIPIGSSSYYENLGTTNQNIEYRGGSAGMGILVNPETNNGYFLEVIALSETNVSKYSSNANIQNIVFYKTTRQKDAVGFEGTIQNSDDAIPVKLWGATAQILVDDGKFTGQYRQANEQSPTVYDIAVEYENLDNGNSRKFYIYFNGNLAGTVIDTDPLPEYTNQAALFVRGSSKAMFENIYGLAHNYSQNTSDTLSTPVNAVFGSTEVSINQSFRKYAMSGLVQSTYLSSIDPNLGPQYDIYFEEFGTILREAAYFNVRYDKAYPAIYAKMSPTFNNIKGYTVSGFVASPYDAEFLIFNNTDTILSLDETTGNYLRIQGVTFTQQSQHDYSLDEYMAQTSDLSDTPFGQIDSLDGIVGQEQTYQDIKNSRVSYGRQEFTLQSTYLQDQDSARDMMKWLVSKVTKPRKSLGVEVFNMPHIQLGDIATVDYDIDGTDQIKSTRYVVYSMQHQYNETGPSMTLYLSEVT